MSFKRFFMISYGWIMSILPLAIPAVINKITPLNELDLDVQFMLLLFLIGSWATAYVCFREAYLMKSRH